MLQLQSFEVEHHHGRIGDPDDKPYGNGVLLWFEVDDFDAVEQRAAQMGVEVVLPRHRNPPDGNGGPNHWEIGVRDPDGYVVVAASAQGTAQNEPWCQARHAKSYRFLSRFVARSRVLCALMEPPAGIGSRQRTRLGLRERGNRQREQRV